MKRLLSKPAVWASSRLTSSLLALSCLAFSAGAALAATPLDLLQAPPTSSFKSIAPNLTFMLDDSGSMQWEYLGTNGSIESFNYGFPIGFSVVYGIQNYQDVIPGFESDNIYAAQFRAAAVNPNYYNPAVTYLPWACAAYPEDPSHPPSGTNGMPPSDLGTCQWNDEEKLWLFPNADPNKAYLNPYDTGKGWRSLIHWNDSDNANDNTADNGYIGASYASTQWLVRTGSGYSWWPGRYPNTIASTRRKTYAQTTGFWPATYFNYFGSQPVTSPSDSNLSEIDNYQRIQICPAASYSASTPTYDSSGNPTGNTTLTACTQPPALPTSPAPYHTYIATSGTYTNPEGQSITCGTDAAACYVHVNGDGSLVVRTYAQEIQNFANWYQYDRSHILLARAGVSQAFMKLPENFRVNFALLNDMADGPDKVQYSTVHEFNLDVRQNFLQRLFQTPIPTQGTPSRIAVYNIGEWLSQAPNQSAPWGARDAERTALIAAGITDDNEMLQNLSCRQNYLLFATDGDWNGDGSGTGNQDGTAGSTITGPGGQSYTYAAVAPYTDTYSDTLADNAMKFWKNDIQTGLPNDVPTNSQDPAFWQHMVMFGVGLGVNGTSDLPQMLAGTTAWPNPSSGSLYRIDDLAHAGLDTRGGYLSAADPSAFASALTTTLSDIANRVASSTSAAVSAQPAGEYKTTTQAFAALYHPNGWWGELLAYPIVRTTNGGLAQGQYANWNASCVLTGGACPSMQNSPQVTPQTSRVLLTWHNNAGAVFDASSTGLDSNLAAYLAGSRTLEGSTYRKRTGVLGDIVDSSPLWVGAPSYGYGTNIKDLLSGTTGPETSYASFQTAQAQREHIVYVGANDGLVHGFRAGSNDANGDFDAANNDGHEVLAYFPSVLASTIGNYASPNYVHQYYVNATPGTGDLFFDNAWHTWLVGGLGAGGRGFYALDITDPSQFSSSNPTSLVKAEVNPGNIDALCGVSDGSCSNDLGDTFGTPIIRRMHDGKWAVIAGNGYNSPSGNASIFIALIDPSTGDWQIKKIQLAGPVDAVDANGNTYQKANGVAYVSAADLDGDRIADYLYAADLYGHVWRVDVTGSSSSAWTAPAQPLYSAKDASGTAQPITTQLAVASVPQSSGDPRVMVMFGTGSSLTQTDLDGRQTQTVYGIWDGDMANWNSKSSVKYAAWASTPASLGRSNLQQQTIIDLGTQDGLSYRSLSNNEVSSSQYGWYVDLPASGERVIYNPVLLNGALQLNTSIPSAGIGLMCNITPASGFTMAFNPASGGLFTVNNTGINFFADKNNKLDYEGQPIMGIGLGATGSVGIIRDQGKTFAILNQQSGGIVFNQQRTLGGTGPGGRISWIQLR
ncbi:MAG: pilus assembly protein [Thiomonas sp.]